MTQSSAADHTARPQTGAPPEDEELIMFLERDQLASGRAKPVPRAELARTTKLALWALRVFALVVSLMVIYTFIVQLN